MRLPAKGLAFNRWSQTNDADLLWQNAEGVQLMVRELFRSCPKCRGCLAVILREPEYNTPLQAVNSRCLRCGHRMA